jgi:hypothetical protein
MLQGVLMLVRVRLRGTAVNSPPLAPEPERILALLQFKPPTGDLGLTYHRLPTGNGSVVPAVGTPLTA